MREKQTDARGSYTPLVFVCVALCYLSSVSGWAPVPSCDVSAGRWVPTKEIMVAKFRNSDDFGCSLRRPKLYLKYQWSAPFCNITRLEAEAFLSFLSNMSLMIVGDSISKNLYSAIRWTVDSAQIQTLALPQRPDLLPDTFEGFFAPEFNATVFRVYSNFFVATKKREAMVLLDEVDPTWTSFLPLTNFVAFVGFHHYFHRGVSFYVRQRRRPDIDPVAAIYRATGEVGDYLAASNYSGVPMLFTITPAHYSDLYIPGGYASCVRAHTPFTPQELRAAQNRSIYTRTTKLVKKRLAAQPWFKLIDVTRLSLGRPDGHGSSGSGRLLPFTDCSHWCVPGVPNTWADILFSAMLGRL